MQPDAPTKPVVVREPDASKGARPVLRGGPSREAGSLPSKPVFDPRRLDVRRFAQEAGALGAEATLRDFGRLFAETAGRGGDLAVHWSATGQMRNPAHVHPEIWLHLKADATLPLVCQRCLHEVDVPLAVERDFRFVPDEARAAAEDDESEEDVLAESRSFDLLALVEDELLMDLPVVPRHDTCPVDLPTSATDEAFEAAQGEKANPFAALARLKAGKG